MKRILVSLFLVLTMVVSSICCVGAAEPGTVEWFKGKFESSDPSKNTNVEEIEIPVKIEVKLSSGGTYGSAVTTTAGQFVDLKATLDMSAVKNLVASGKAVLDTKGEYDDVKDYPVTGLFVIKTSWAGILEEDTVNSPLAKGDLVGFEFDGVAGDVNTPIFDEAPDSRDFDIVDGKNVGVTAYIDASTTVDGVVTSLPSTITLEHKGLKVIGFDSIGGEFIFDDAFASTFTKVEFDDEARFVDYKFEVTPAKINKKFSNYSGGGVPTTYPLNVVDEDGKTVILGRYSADKEVTLDKAPEEIEGKKFLGWATEAGGDVVYKLGDTFKMPKSAVTLYPVWGDQPSLNKDEHFAYIKGYPDGTVRPEANISREEVATIFFRLLSAETRELYLAKTHNFVDVEADRWSNEAIATLAKAAIINGRTGTVFAPEASITRAEFATIAARFDSEPYTAGEDMFNDISGHWAAEYINRAATRGWVTGDGNGTFRPDDYITRAEAATLINRVLERNPETAEDLLETMIKFPDNADVNAWYYLNVQEAANDHDYVRKEDGVHESWVSL